MGKNLKQRFGTEKVAYHQVRNIRINIKYNVIELDVFRLIPEPLSIFYSRVFPSNVFLSAVLFLKSFLSAIRSDYRTQTHTPYQQWQIELFRAVAGSMFQLQSSAVIAHFFLNRSKRKIN